MKNLTKLALTETGIAAVGVAAAAAVSYKTAKTLVSVALDRETPKVMKSKQLYKTENTVEKFFYLPLNQKYQRYLSCYY